MGTIYPGEYTFTFKDYLGDSLIWGPGYYELYINDQIVAKGSDDIGFSKSTTFILDDSCDIDIIDTGNDRDCAAVGDTETCGGLHNWSDGNARLVINFDNKPEENSWRIYSDDDNAVDSVIREGC